jgi:hypothetical protein
MKTISPQHCSPHAFSPSLQTMKRLIPWWRVACQLVNLQQSRELELKTWCRNEVRRHRPLTLPRSPASHTNGRLAPASPQHNISHRRPSTSPVHPHRNELHGFATHIQRRKPQYGGLRPEIAVAYLPQQILSLPMPSRCQSLLAPSARIESQSTAAARPLMVHAWWNEQKSLPSWVGSHKPGALGFSRSNILSVGQRMI